MKNINWDYYLSAGAGGVAALIHYVWGGLDVMLIALAGAMVLDYITGLLCAVKSETVDSRVAFRGITRKKGMILVMVAFAVLLDSMTGTPGIWRAVVIGYYFVMEGISILENAAKAGLPVPASLKRVLIQLKEQADNADDKRGE